MENTLSLDTNCITVPNYALFFWPNTFVIDKNMVIGRISYGNEHKTEAMTYISYKDGKLEMDLDNKNFPLEILYDNLDYLRDLLVHSYEQANKSIKPKEISFYGGKSFKF